MAAVGVTTRLAAPTGSVATSLENPLMSNSSAPKRWSAGYCDRGDPPQPDITHAAPPALAASTTAPPTLDLRAPAVPYWIPAGVELAQLPGELQAALAGIINPIYRALVLDA